MAEPEKGCVLWDVWNRVLCLYDCAVLTKWRDGDFETGRWVFAFCTVGSNPFSSHWFWGICSNHCVYSILEPSGGLTASVPFDIYLSAVFGKELYRNQEFGDEKQAVKREIIYFPSFYYQYKRGMVLITVRLDGSKFHQAGNFEDMTKILEDTYSSNVVDITQRKEYLTYHLMRNAAKNRLRMDELEVKGYKIPLMRNLSWDISKVPHGLVVGGTGGGKTYFLHVLIREFLQMDAVLYICDPKYSSLTDYRMVLPHVASDVSGIMALVEECVQVMQQRYQEIKDRPDYMPGQDFTHYHMQPIVLFFDEYTAYVSMLDRKEKEIFKQNLNQIVLKGREAGVFVILATQRPDAEYLSGNMRDQLGFRVTLGVLKEDGYRMAFGNTTQKFRSSGQPGYGFLYMNGFSFIQRFCAALVPEGYHFIEEAGKLLEQRKGGGQKDV